ncbi:Bone morphogenetic protein receptor type-2 [Chionoecetes opilio]|uniref:receptor protein serine/threonine kinase n=1 Tax=Chionoecetes opilio TaxID=41210 RepID=A0A8J5CGF5_CHIOP|nr:Bone morphogenetic protein receptor type-2 [Chionoecetes opilio]
MCNVDVVVPEVVEEPSPPPLAEDKKDEAADKSYLWLWVLLIVAFVLLGTCIVVGARRWKRTKPPPLDLPPEEHPASSCIDLESVKILETIGQGRFGTAYRAIVDEEEVAVKMFPQHHKSSYTNEKYIYSLPLMEHSNLLSYLGSGERVGQDGNIYYGLVLSYCPKGRLSTYLSENTITWSTFCSIALSATRGLAHLHSEIRKGDTKKPCICHRDFNTRNLLLNENMQVIVSDLGFAIHTQGSKYYVNGEEQHAETSSLTDVGTLRYMAPEVLEGAVNLRDCEAALKQIDIYALGLVLWECAARCHELYQGLQTPPYMLPFQAEIGLHPSFEQVQVLVVRNKARPLFPSVWKDTNPATRLLKETIDDCWDYDADARLSAMCVEGRLTELPTLWDRYKLSLGINGVSPTLNPMSNLPLSQRAGEMINGGKIISNVITPRDKESSVSEATVETTITGSPSEPSLDVFLAKNQLIGTLQPPIPSLQPHQGRNPCMERNLIREIPHEISVSGNILIDPLKSNDINSINSINTINAANLIDVQHAIESHGLTNEHLMPLLNGHSNTASVMSQPRPMLPPPTLVPPIPYLQNEVHSVDNQPKRQNTAMQVENYDNRRASKGSSWRRWRSAWEERLKSLIPRRRHHNGEDEERQEILITPTSSSLSEPPTPLPATQSVTVASPHLALQTEVLLTNGGPHTVISPNHTLNSQHSALPNYTSETEIGIAKLHFQNGFAPIIKSRQGSKDSGLNKSSENSVSFVDSDNSCEKLRRPTTLILPDRSHKGTINNVEEEIKSSVDNIDHNEESKVTDSAPEVEESPPLRKAKHRVKTPRRPLNPRLSLYDDRIMGCEGETGVQAGKGGGHLDVGLSHSLPLHMNALSGQQPFLASSVPVSSASSQNNSAASLRCSKLVSSANNSSSSSSSSRSSSSRSSSSRASSREGSQGLLGQELTFSCTQPNPQTIGVL